MSVVLNTEEDFRAYAEKLFKAKQVQKLLKLAAALSSKGKEWQRFAKDARSYARAAILLKAKDTEGAAEALVFARGKSRKTKIKTPKAKVAKRAKAAGKKAPVKKARRTKGEARQEASLIAALKAGNLLNQNVVAVKNPARRRRNPDAPPAPRGSLYHAAALGKTAYRGARKAYGSVRDGWRENPEPVLVAFDELDFAAFGRGFDYTELHANRGKVQQWIAERDGEVFCVALKSMGSSHREIGRAIRNAIANNI